MSRSSIRRTQLAHKAEKGFRGFPIATLAFYGPDNSRASKVAVGIVLHEGAEPIMSRFFSEQGDVRHEPEIQHQVAKLLTKCAVRSVVAATA